MKIEILDEAQEDLTQGFHFYESREPGLGSYFIDCLFSDIDSLFIYAGIHQVVFAGRHIERLEVQSGFSRGDPNR